MPLSRRYTPEHPSGTQVVYGMSFETIIPPGAGIEDGSQSVEVWTNTVAPVLASSVNPNTLDWETGPVSIEGRVVYAPLSGGIDGTDYQVRWSLTDTDGNSWRVTGLILCSETS
jgi:hypothetical protein